MILSKPFQRKSIGYFRKILGIDDDTYKEILANYNVDSSKNLTYQYANELLNNLKNKAISLNLYSPKLKYENMFSRYGMATPKQLRMIEAMWADVSNQSTLMLKQKALNKFVKKITNKDHIKFLTKDDIKKVVLAIKTMQKKGINNA